MLRTIDHVVLPVSTLEAAAPFERIGISLTPPARHAGQGTENRVFVTGSAAGEFYVEFLAAHDAAAAAAALGSDAPRAGEAAALQRVAFATDDLDGMRKRLQSANVNSTTRRVDHADGTLIGHVLTPQTDAAGTRFTVLQYGEGLAERAARHGNAGLFEHRFPLKRLDHLAAIVHDIDAVTAFWTGVLGVPLYGEVSRPGSVIRQMKVGDAIFELIGPTEPNSPMLERPQGLISMCAFEVTDMATAVAAARAAGFTCGDAAEGPLPGTRVTTVPGGEMCGMGLQLLEYV